MTLMLGTGLFTIGVLILLAALFLYQAWSYRRKHRGLLTELADEAENLLERLKNEKDFFPSESQLANSNTDEDSDYNSLASKFSSAKYLSTIVTVMVKQSGGKVTLTENDFHSITGEEYVSVYVDTADNSIILFLNSPTSPFYNDDEEEIVYN